LLLFSFPCLIESTGQGRAGEMSEQASHTPFSDQRDLAEPICLRQSCLHVSRAQKATGLFCDPCLSARSLGVCNYTHPQWWVWPLGICCQPAGWTPHRDQHGDRHPALGQCLQVRRCFSQLL